MTTFPTDTAIQAAPRASYLQRELSNPKDEGALAGYVGEIARPTDQILMGLGGDLTHYEKLLRDDQVHACFQQRRRAVTQCEWQVTAGGESELDQAAAALLDAQLRRIEIF